jgi:outer membrane receptor protein involved in Fe transport
MVWKMRDKINYRLFYLFVVPALVILVTGLFAGTTGKIAGRVIDTGTGEPLPGVNIFVEAQALGAASDVDGYFYILNISPGKYTVIAQMIGYRDVRFENVKVTIDQTTTLNIKMVQTVVESADEIVVVAERPLIDVDVTSSAVSISADEIQAMPVDNFNEVVNNQAGVVAGHFRGGRSGEVKYMVDGLPVNDPYSNSQAVTVENVSIQELEIISGTFNAEYGQAMSGIVNIITRDGRRDRIETEFSGYVGNFYSIHDKIFPNIDRVDGKGTQNLQLTVNGPVPYLENLSFFITGRYEDDEGYYFGNRLYLPTDSDPYLPSGDSSYVSMDSSRHRSLQGKLTYFLSPQIRFSYNLLWGRDWGHDYDHAYRLTPDGLVDNYGRTSNQSFIFNHTLSNSTFYTIKFSQNFNRYYGYLYKNPYDPRYVIPEQGLPQSGYTFRSGGNQNWRYDRFSLTDIVKVDLVTQMNRHHKIGTGFIALRYKIKSVGSSFNAGNEASTNIHSIEYPDIYAPGYAYYIKKPYEASAYVQDKMEYDDLIINLGLRYDYFNPNTYTLGDARNPEYNNLFPFYNVKAKDRMQLSPRLGIAFPISSAGVIHVSYGHFFQTPNHSQLYAEIKDMPDGTTRFLIDKQGLSTAIGNPNLDAQRTTMYEAGIQQGLTAELALDFTAYYRDVRNLIDTEILETYDGYRFARYINKDYANIRGLIMSLEKRFSSMWGARIDFTYQFAEGNASDPLTVFYDNQSETPDETEKRFLPLDWDQRSTLNVSVNVGKPGNWMTGLIGRYGTGTPYSAEVRWTGVNVNWRNNRIKPSSLTFDLRGEKVFKVMGTRVSAYFLVYNLLDRLNEWGVYGSSGRAGVDLNTRFAGDVVGLTSIQDYVNNPTMYSPPREIRLGLSFGLEY